MQQSGRAGVFRLRLSTPVSSFVGARAESRRAMVEQAPMQVKIYCRNELLAEDVRVAATFWSRLRGLLGSIPLTSGQGLLIDPCNSVHTVGMSYPIDVLFVSEAGEVLHVERAMPPLRMSRIHWNSRFVVELAAGGAEKVQPGDRLTVQPI